MMKDKDFWKKVIDVLREREQHNYIVWSFSVLHEDPEIFAEYLSMTPMFKANLGYFFQSPLIKTAGLDYQHREFNPLVNARAYRLGNKDRITNKQLNDAYQEFLQYLAEKPALADDDYICWSLFMIYQDRLEDAATFYSRINKIFSENAPTSNRLQLQYDYLSCYLDLEKAALIAPLYENYPVEAWRKYFKEVNQLIKELSADFVEATTVKEKEPSLNFEVDQGSSN